MHVANKTRPRIAILHVAFQCALTDNTSKHQREFAVTKRSTDVAQLGASRRSRGGFTPTSNRRRVPCAVFQQRTVTNEPDEWLSFQLNRI